MIPDIDRLIRAFSKKRVVLILGPDAIPYFNSAGEESTFSRLSREGICNALGDGKYKYFEHERLFCFKDADSKQRAREIVEDLSSIENKEWLPDYSLLQMIIALPFPLIFNLNPDLDVYRAFGKYWEYPQFGFVGSQALEQEEFKEVDPYDNPILFQLAGCVERSEASIILDYNDVFAVLKNILSAEMESTEIVKQLQHTTHYLVMGTNLDRWYFQLLLHYLNNIPRSSSPFDNSNKNIVMYCNITENAELFLREQFHIEKTDLTREDFEILYEKFKEENILMRKLVPGGSSGADFDKIRALLEQEDSMSKVLTILENKKDETLDQNEIIRLQALLSETKKQFHHGMIDEEERNEILVHIKESLLQMTPKLRSQ